MDFGSFTTGLLTGLREGVEAALIVSIILAYLAKTGNRRQFGKIWLGAGAAIALSVLVGGALWLSIGGLEGAAEQVFEGVAMVLAAAVVTWMLFWMRRTAANIKGELHSRVDSAIVEGSVLGLALLAFTAVIREGIETALFLLGQASAAATREAGALSVLAGAGLGLLLAAAIGFVLYRGAQIINLRSFFQWTGVALIFIAAGLLSHAVHEFVEVGWISVGTGTAFDISSVLPDDPASGALGVIGSVLRAVFGYSSDPEWATFLTWLGYLLIVLTLYLRPMKPVQTSSRLGASSAASA